jgi:hypothetical protein
MKPCVKCGEMTNNRVNHVPCCGFPCWDKLSGEDKHRLRGPPKILDHGPCMPIIVRGKK